MKRLLCLASFVVLWTTTSSGQVLLPLAAVPSSACGNYATLLVTFAPGVPACAYTAHFPWFAAGNGWSTVISFTNTGTKGMTYEIFFEQPQGSNAAVYEAASSVPPLSSVSLPLNSGSSIDEKIVSGATCDANLNCAPMSGLQTGSVEVLVMAPDAATLDAQKAAQLTFIYTPADGSPTWQVAVPLVRDVDATVCWGAQFTETPIPMKANNPSSNSTSMAVLNLSDQPQSVLITISDSNNHPIVTAQTPPLAPGATSAVMLTDMFGDTMFPQAIGQDGLLHGNLSFKGMGGGKIVPLVLRAIGSSISSLQVWQTSSN